MPKVLPATPRSGTSEVPLTPPQSNQNSPSDGGGDKGLLAPPKIIPQSEWINDSCRSNCRLCRALFTQINRRHHCRVIGEVVCGGCSLHEEVEGTFVRVSLRAFRQHLRHFPLHPAPVPRMLFGREFGKKSLPLEQQIIRAVMQNDVSLFRDTFPAGFSIDAKLHKDGRRALHFAAQEKCGAIVAHLLQGGASVGAKCNAGRTALHLAVRQSDIDVVALLVEAGASINDKDAQDITPLHMAAEASSATLGELLGRIDRDISATTVTGAQPLHFAAANLSDDVEAPRLLLDTGIDIAIEDGNSGTPLHYAAGSGNVKIIRLLQEKGAPIEAPDTSGCTPLLIAAKSNHYLATKLLLKLGASPTKQDYDGKTFMHHAVAAGGLPLMALIEHYEIDRPSDAVTVTPSDGFLKYAMPGTPSALAGVPRVPASACVFVQHVSIVNETEDAIMFEGHYEKPAAFIPGKSTTGSPGSYRLSPAHGFVAPRSTCKITVELRMPTSRLYKEFESDKMRFQMVKINQADVLDPSSAKIWTRIDNTIKKRFTIGVKARVFDPGNAPGGKGLVISPSGNLVAAV